MIFHGEVSGYCKWRSSCLSWRTIQGFSAYGHVWRGSTCTLSLTHLLQSQMNVIALFLRYCMVQNGLVSAKKHGKERSWEPDAPPCRLSQGCPCNQPAGHRDTNCWGNGSAQHCTALCLVEYLLLNDLNRLPLHWSTSSLLSAISRTRLSQQVFTRVTSKILITKERKIGKTPAQVST